MKMILGILNNDDAPVVIQHLNKSGYFVTRLSTSGGFLRAGNVTILVGVDNEKVRPVIDIIHQYSRSRKQLMPTTSEAGIGFFPTMPVEVQVGGATIFVLDVDHFEKILMRLPHLLGNTRLKEALASLPPSGVGSAVLLDGPAGIGKRTAAADLAAGLVCPDPNGPCGVCPSCRRAAAGSHPDLIWLQEPEAGKGVKLEQVRALRAQSFLRPSEAPLKVFVIPQADRLNLPSQNALLKVLEEPSASVFLLLCENREAMLQTVRSRCKTFRLTPLRQETLWDALASRSDAPAEARQAAAKQAGGLLGRALDILSGQEKAGFSAARSFVAALNGDELAIFCACQGLLKLTREDYADFCDESCRLLTGATAQTGSRQFIDIFEYLEKQRAMLSQNPSITALSGALAAFCGAC